MSPRREVVVVAAEEDPGGVIEDKRARGEDIERWGVDDHSFFFNYLLVLGRLFYFILILFNVYIQLSVMTDPPT